ncbi:MAG: hypothetical protein WD423_06825 [Rhodothermales bacterium]
MKALRFPRVVAVFLSIAIIVVQVATAQTQGEPAPLANFVVAGYGSATYGAVTSEDLSNDFTAAVSPVMLYSMGSDLLFETELEFGLSGQATTTALEYAQVDYLGFNRVQLIAGKFLMPFGVFTERFHPSWINKMPTAPLLYGHAHGGVAEGALLPMLSDAGVLVRAKQPVGGAWSLDVSAWVTQGPRLVEAGAGGDDHAEEADDGHAHKVGGVLDEDHGEELSASDLTIPDVGFGVAFADNNKNKLIGGRVGVVHGPRFESYVSGFYAMYDDESFLHIYGLNYSLDVQSAGFELHGEATVLHQEFPTDTGYDEFARWGYYAQVSRRVGSFEPVVRWSQLAESEVRGVVAFEDRQEFAAGLNFWISPSVPVKVAYALDSNGDDRILVQWAFGF